MRGKPEITRFKGLGEISPNEFGRFIGADMRLEPVILQEGTTIEDILDYYMGKNTPERQEFIIENLRTGIDEIRPNEVPVIEAEAEELEEELV